jgi:hypothetical protein
MYLFRTPGLLMDPRPFADVGRIFILYLLSKHINVFKACTEDVLAKRATKIAHCHRNDFLFTSLDDGCSDIEPNSMGKANRRLCADVRIHTITCTLVCVDSLTCDCFSCSDCLQSQVEENGRHLQF